MTKPTLTQVENLINSIKLVNSSGISSRNILFQGEARRMLPALVNIAPHIPTTIKVLRSFRDNPFNKIDNQSISQSIDELLILEEHRKKETCQTKVTIKKSTENFIQENAEGDPLSSNKGGLFIRGTATVENDDGKLAGSGMNRLVSASEPGEKEALPSSFSNGVIGTL